MTSRLRSFLGFNHTTTNIPHPTPFPQHSVILTWCHKRLWTETSCYTVFQFSTTNCRKQTVVLGFGLTPICLWNIWLIATQPIHTWQACGVSPVCHMTWFIKCSFRVKDFLHMSHLWGVSPVCLRTWFTMCSLRVNVLAQYWQRYGVSPVWQRVWLSRCSLRAKDLPHTVHPYGLSVACRFMCRSRLAAFANTWKHTAHVYMLPPRWHLPCRLSSAAHVNAFPHTWKYNVRTCLALKSSEKVD